MQFRYLSASAMLIENSAGAFNLVNLKSEEPHQGHATILMRMITDYADFNNLRLELHANRYFYTDSKGLDNKELVRFYEQFGFKVIGDIRDRIMVRQAHESQGL